VARRGLKRKGSFTMVGLVYQEGGGASHDSSVEEFGQAYNPPCTVVQMGRNKLPTQASIARSLAVYAEAPACVASPGFPRLAPYLRSNSFMS
jgi:hypothetical protein